MRTRIIAPALGLALVLALSITEVSAAHEGREHLKGTIESIDEATLVIQTVAGEPASLRITGETRYQTPGGSSVDRARLQAGIRVVVEVVEDEDGMRAELVLLPEDAAGATPHHEPVEAPKAGH